LWGVIFFAVSYFNTILTDKESLQKSNAKNLRFKRNYDLFKRELVQNERITFTDTQTFSLGNKEARLRISVVSNPYCGFCKGAHEILEELLKKYPNEISAQIRFNYFSDKSNEKSTGLLSDFTSIYKNKHESEFLKAVETWFENRDEKQISVIAGASSQVEDLSLLNQMSLENADAGLNFTPIFIINGFQFPDKYDREDIHYFIDELIEDEEI
jgi:thiol-disulfide isomerase/thioredoxin